MPDLGDLYRKFSRAIETGKGIRLSPAEVDLLVVTGAYKALSDAVAEQLRDLVLKRRPELQQLAELVAKVPVDQGPLGDADETVR